jgi:hypothetical protein
MSDDASVDGASNEDGREAKAAPAEPVREELVLTIGGIGVSPHWVVTPSGNIALADSQWTVADQSRSVKKHPVWTIVLAVVLFPIGLLLLLVTTESVVGYVEVKVRGPGLAYTAQVPVTSPYAVQTVRRQVAEAESMAAAFEIS